MYLCYIGNKISPSKYDEMRWQNRSQNFVSINPHQWTEYGNNFINIERIAVHVFNVYYAQDDDQ